MVRSSKLLATFGLLCIFSLNLYTPVLAILQSTPAGNVAGANTTTDAESEDDTELIENVETQVDDDMVLETTAETGTDIREKFAEIRKLSVVERLNKIRELQAESYTKRCKLYQDNLQDRLDYYEENHEQYSTRFQGILQKLQTAQAELHTANIDTTELQTKIAEFEALSTSFADAKAELKLSIQRASTLACEEREVEEGYKQSITEVRQYARQLRDIALETRTFLTEEIIPLLKQIAIQQ